MKDRVFGQPTGRSDRRGFSFAAGKIRFGAMPDLEIRAATAADIPAITAIYGEAVQFGTATFELIPPDVTEMTRRFTALATDGFPYLVAVQDGQIAGYAYAGRYHNRPAYRFTVENTIYLAPDSQRRGVGTRLLQRLIDDCEAMGFRQIIALVGDSANAGSIGVHTRCGFQTIGIHPDVGFKFERWLDIVTMQRALGGGGETQPAELVKPEF